jgi:enediyne biosynthesis protein E4
MSKAYLAKYCVLLLPLLFELWPIAAQMDISVTQTSLAVSECSGSFVAHDLDHITIVRGEQVRMFDSNGSGLAINDLDNDGDLDLVLGNLAERSSILWNEGNLSFRKETIAVGQVRAVNVVDVDGNGWQDIVLAHGASAPVYALNQEGRFHFIPLPGIREPAYAMGWADLDGDGDLDTVTGSYDAQLERELGNSFMFSDGAGVFLFEQRDGEFFPMRLSERAQALALLLEDINGDGWLDILVGNDFAVRDQVWLYQPDGWQEVHPFSTMTHSTMSFDAGDIDNNGQLEFFASDMKLYSDDNTIVAAWQPVIDMLESVAIEPDDPQIMENVLQIQTGDGTFENRATDFGVDATGWSWSAKFGDLDNDGFLDLYVVNGMIAIELFRHLSNSELVEENQAFRNQGGEQFTPAPEWDLNATTSGRGMSMADLDSDGDLDIVVNNLLAPAQLFENQLCEGRSLEVDLRWPGSDNTHALGATLSLHTSVGTYYRHIHSQSGYLSGDPSRVHFGIPADSTLTALEIRWPDGAVSRIDSPEAGVTLIVERQYTP